jgi:uncharacterized phage protein (TIGR02218 family)
VIVYPQALLDHLGRDVTTVCYCWRLIRKDGEVTGYTDHDRPLTVNGSAFEPESGFAASEARDSLGLSADTVDVEGVLSSERIADSDVAAGLYDGATVETLLVNWREPQQFALIRVATIGKIVRRDDSFVAELESRTRALDQQNARYVTRLCDAELGDARCGFALDQPGFSGNGAVTGVGPAERVAVSGLDGFDAGWFSGGLLTWTEGARNGRTERIVEHSVEQGGISILLQPRAGAAIEEGDVFSVVAGCDKRFSTCKAKFGNALNFRGFPHLPGNDVAYGYAADGGIFDGGPVVP